MQPRRWSVLAVIAPFAVRIAFMTLFALPALHPFRSGKTALGAASASCAIVEQAPRHSLRIAAPFLSFRTVADLVSPPSPDADSTAVTPSFASTPPDLSYSPEHPPA
jgi:hypothetical protein